MQLEETQTLAWMIALGINIFVLLIFHLKTRKQETPSEHCPFCGQEIIQEPAEHDTRSVG